MVAAILASGRGNINVPDGPFLDPRGNISPAWRIWLLNPNIQSLQSANPIGVYSGGLGVSTTPASGQLPVATSTGVYTPAAFSSLPVFSSTTPGLAPASGGGTTTFLRADATYASPVAGSNGQVQYASSGSFAASALFTHDGAGNVSLGTISGTTAALNITAQAGGTLALRTGTASTAVAVANSGAATQIGLYGVTPVSQASAYVQTYAVASRTVAAATFANLDTTAATNIAPYGFATQVQADAIATNVNALGADVIILKQIINSLINDLGKTSGIGVNAT